MRALIFPGQGSQFVGMGRALVQHSKAARQVFEEADEALGFSLSRLCFEGPKEELDLTVNTQPALLTTSLAYVRGADLESDAFDYLAGHSLGEYTALVVAGSLSLSEAVRLVHLRGRFMQETVPVGAGAMSVVIGLDLAILEQLCAGDAGPGIVEVANDNAPGQVVLAGNTEAVERVGVQAKQAGARRVIPLPVSAPFHTALMEAARDRLSEVVTKIEFGDLKTPLLSTLGLETSRSGIWARETLLEQIPRRVRWVEAVERLVEVGVDDFLEAGPGSVLTGMVRRINRSVRVRSVEETIVEFADAKL